LNVNKKTYRKKV